MTATDTERHRRPPARSLALMAMWLCLAALFATPWLRDRLAPRETWAEYAARSLPVALPGAIRAADDATLAQLDRQLDAVYAPVYAAVPAYADFHFSVLGQYVEIGAILSADLAQGMEDRLFAGFDDRLTAASSALDATWNARFQAALVGALGSGLPPHLSLPPVGQIVRAEVLDRVAVSAPLAAAGATLAGRAGARIAARTITRALVTTMGKLAAKSAARGTGAGAAAGAGAAVGALAGPVGAVAGGVIGGAAAWFGIDFAAVRLDEYLNRDSFEADLVGLIDAQRAATRADLAAALSRHAAAAGATIRDIRAAAAE